MARDPEPECHPPRRHFKSVLTVAVSRQVLKARAKSRIVSSVEPHGEISSVQSCGPNLARCCLKPFLNRRRPSAWAPLGPPSTYMRTVTSGCPRFLPLPKAGPASSPQAKRTVSRCSAGESGSHHRLFRRHTRFLDRRRSTQPEIESAL